MEEEKFSMYLSDGTSLVKSIVEYSRNTPLDAFCVTRFITEKKDQIQVEYHKISKEQNKMNQDDSSIVTEGTAYKFTVDKTGNESDPYVIRESRTLAATGTDLYQFPVSEAFKGQYEICFIPIATMRNDVRELFRYLT
jgi:hypothetical protein